MQKYLLGCNAIYPKSITCELNTYETVIYQVAMQFTQSVMPESQCVNEGTDTDRRGKNRT